MAAGLTASFVAAGVSAFGILTMIAIGARAHRFSAYFSAFAVGLLSAAVLFHLFPEALDDSQDAWLWAGAGLGAMAIVSLGVQLFFLREQDGGALAFAYSTIVALGVHSLMDGAVYAASFQQETFTGVISVAALLLHEFPEGIIVFVLFREAGQSTGVAGWGAFVVAGVSTVVGALGGYAAIEFLSAPTVSLLYGTAAGALIYILLRHLIPHAARTPKQRGYAIAALGVIVGTLAIIFERAGAGH